MAGRCRRTECRVTGEVQSAYSVDKSLSGYKYTYKRKALVPHR